MAGRALRGWVALIAAAVIALVVPRVARAAEPVVVTADVGEIPLGRHVDYLEDPGGKLTLDDVGTAEVAKRFRESERDVPNFGFSTSSYWFRFELENDTSAPMKRMLEIAYAVLSHVDLYVPRPDGSFTPHVTGRAAPFSTRDVPHGDFVFRTVLAPGRQTFFLRIATEGSLQVPVTLWSPVAFTVADQTAGLGSGLFYGAMFVMLAYNLFLFLAVRDRSYLYYATYVLVFAGFQALIDGYLLEYAWPESPGWNTQCWKLTAMSLGLTMALFTRKFLDLRDTLPRWHRFLNVEIGIFAVALGCSPFVSYHTVTLYMSGVGGILAPGLFVTGVRAWLHGLRAARFYVIAWSVLLVGSTAFLLSKLGLVGHSFATEHSWQIGCALEVVLISFALADRLNQMKAEKEQAQAHALVLQRDANENLRSEVARQTQELRDQATKLVELDRQKTHFFQNVSHELRTPLTLILNPLDELVRDATFSRDPRIDVAIKNARRLLRLVNQLLDFQKLAAGKREMRFEPIDATAFARSCGEYFAPACAAQGIVFHVRAEGEVVVSAEADALEKIVFNFLANALKYTPRGKAIELFVQAPESPAGKVRIGVRDDGPGISEEGQERLFQLFSQVDRGRGAGLALANEGTGLGLALAKELAEAMGGSAGVESRLGEGSTFFVDLPRIDAPAVEAKATGRAMADVVAARPSEHVAVGAPLSVPSAAEGAHILVVDDLVDMRELVGRTLARRGYRVELAAGGREALARAAVQRPDCIVTDWMMPEMTGPELVTALRADADLRAVPVVLLTAKSDEESKLAGTEIGADAFLGKPFNESELFSTVRNLVQLKEREREVERLNRHIAENVLKRYLPAELVDDILAGRTSVDVEPETVQATILFGDLAGFTRMSAKLRAAKMARLLNEYLGKMNDVVFAHGGTIDKYMGDGIMVIFGAPVRLEAKDQVRRAAACAIAMQHAMTDLNARWLVEGLPEVKLRVGLHHGPVVVGNFGDARRSDYTAIGPTVNLASRIEGACPEGGVLVSGEVYDFLPEEMAEDAGAFELKGVEGIVRCFRLVLGTPSRASLAIH